MSDGITVQRAFWGVGVGLVAFAWSAGPLLRFVDPAKLAATGLLALITVAVFYECDDKGASYTWSRMFFWSGTLLAALTIWFANSLASTAIEDARANDTRCLIIQSDMLQAHPRIANGPDKFQALGCRPQGTDAKIFVPPTDRERAARKALPSGGYPPPR